MNLAALTFQDWLRLGAQDQKQKGMEEGRRDEGLEGPEREGSLTFQSRRKQHPPELNPGHQ